jgi:hypothetical protein
MDTGSGSTALTDPDEVSFEWTYVDDDEELADTEVTIEIEEG